jgi:hypothetical protein
VSHFYLLKKINYIEKTTDKMYRGKVRSARRPAYPRGVRSTRMSAQDRYNMAMAMQNLAAQQQTALMPGMAYGPGVIDYSSALSARGSSRKAKQAARVAASLQRQMSPYGMPGVQTMSIPVTPMSGASIGYMGGVMQGQVALPATGRWGAQIDELTWDNVPNLNKDLFKWSIVLDLGNHHTAETWDTLKDHVVLFGDDVTTDAYAEHLSPSRCSGPLPLMVPVPKSYPSPMHYVEAMKIVTSSSPAMLLGGLPAQQQMSAMPHMDSCDIARIQSDMLVQQPYASTIKTMAETCKSKAVAADFFKPETILCRFWLSLWISLWAKYSLYPRHMNVLLGTGKKLLIYAPTDGDTLYGVKKEENSEVRNGTNAVGILLLFMRTMARNGWLSDRRTSPTAMYDTYVKPVLAHILDSSGESLK